VFTVIKMRLQYVSSSKFKIIDDGWAWNRGILDGRQVCSLRNHQFAVVI
jgi:hypothetical protein